QPADDGAARSGLDGRDGGNRDHDATSGFGGGDTARGVLQDDRRVRRYPEPFARGEVGLRVRFATRDLVAGDGDVEPVPAQPVERCVDEHAVRRRDEAGAHSPGANRVDELQRTRVHRQVGPEATHHLVDELDTQLVDGDVSAGVRDHVAAAGVERATDQGDLVFR